MNERPTPETDARTYISSLGASTVPAVFARRLERERDEARRELCHLCEEQGQKSIGDREMSEWETFCDESYYHLWRVRRKNERGFNDGFHVQNREEAEALVELLNRLERERNEARDDLAEETKFHHRTHSELVQVQCQLQDVIRERDEAMQSAEAFSALAWKLEGERNEAMGEIKRLRYEAQKEAEHHDRMVKELEGLYDKLKS